MSESRPPISASTLTGERIQAMDVLRGVALFGIFVVNLPAMSLPSDAAYAADPEGSIADTAAWAVVTGGFMAKFFALFSTLFGMGLVLQMQRATSVGRNFERLYKRRLLFLACVGLVHGVFLFVGDILFVYSVAGFVLYLCRRCRVRTYLISAAVLLVVGTSLTLAGTAIESIESAQSVAASTATPAPTWALHENVTWKQLFDGGEDQWPAFERKAYADGPYLSTLMVGIAGFVIWLVISSTISFNWHVLAYFFLGAALMKLDVFAPANRPLHRKMAVVGFGLGLPAVSFSVWDQWASQSESGRGPLTVLSAEAGSVLLAGAYFGTVVLLVRGGRFPRVARALAAAGRMALTNYLLQSMVGNVLFRPFGLDLWGEVSRVGLFGVALLTFAGQILFSALWLHRFGIGPFEWIWRRVTYAESKAKE